MSLEAELAEHFAKHDFKWKMKTSPRKVPDETDILEALDSAAADLYNEDVGAELHVGRLIIRKEHKGFDVYVYVGQYD